ncbi:MAG: o-succinylbenzoate synthase [Bowdeniella nasicola]|nr:o-succinylbenzoate synthase [Bowdeniella nasicola]
MIGVYHTPMRTRFRGITARNGVILQRGSDAREFSPFAEYDDDYAARWLAAAVEDFHPRIIRQTIPVNVTIPAVSATDAHQLVHASGGCTTAKVKVGEPGQKLGDDIARLEAVRDALGPGGHIRIDANTAWSVEQAVRILPQLDRAAGGLQYAEQPVATTAQLAKLRRKVDIPLAADESIRRAADPLAVKRLDAADFAIIKVQPLGGIRAATRIAEALGLPTVISSALESSVGLFRGVQLAASLDDELVRASSGEQLACGLATVHLLERDVTTEPLVPTGGRLSVRAITPTRIEAPAAVSSWWLTRLTRVAQHAGIDLDPWRERP